MNRRRGCFRTGVTLVEVVLSLFVVATMLAGSLHAVGASKKTQALARDKAAAAILADDLLGFIAKLDYKSPSGSLLGIELGNLLGDKTTYDDVDDFHGYTETPPKTAINKTMSMFTGWSREVAVEYIVAADPTNVVGMETGVKRITVTVKKGRVVLAQRIAFRADVPQ